VRVEDVDPPREVPGASQRQLRALTAFGLHADEPIVQQSQRGPLYQAALDRLLRQGDAFICHCSRSDLAATGGVHRQCVAKAERPDPAIRLRVPDDTVIEFDDALRGAQAQDISREVGDFVLRRAEGFWAYQLAVVVDDDAQGITDVVRGADLLDSTPRQIFLQRALGLSTPRYAHLPLVLDAEGRKLSKSDGALPVNPDAPVPALQRAWLALGQDPALVAGIGNVPEFLDASRTGFRPERIPRTGHVIAASHNIGFIIAS
jgi:glutamyl-Q tRNA(Asp) synthetase